jgi:hypothetical protein
MKKLASKEYPSVMSQKGLYNSGLDPESSHSGEKIRFFEQGHRTNKAFPQF